MTKGVSSAVNTEQCDLCGVRGMVSEDGVGVEAGQGEIRVYSTAAGENTRTLRSAGRRQPLQAE